MRLKRIGITVPSCLYCAVTTKQQAKRHTANNRTDQPNMPSPFSHWAGSQQPLACETRSGQPMDEHPSRDRAGAAVRSSGRRLPNVKVPWVHGDRGMRVRERGTPNGELRAPSVGMVKSLSAGAERWPAYRRTRSGGRLTSG